MLLFGKTAHPEVRDGSALCLLGGVVNSAGEGGLPVSTKLLRLLKMGLYHGCGVPAVQSCQQ